MTDRNSRLERVREHLGLNKTEMAEVMGITPHYYYGILSENGKANLRIDHLESLLKDRDVNPAWILTGEGAMFLDNESTPTEWIAGAIVPDIPITYKIDEELLNYFTLSVMKFSQMPMSHADLSMDLLIRFGKYYIYRNKGAARDNLDIPSLTASFLALLQTVQSMVSAVFELESGDKVTISFEGRQYSFVRHPRPAK